jgi:hypothetical protein
MVVYFVNNLSTYIAKKSSTPQTKKKISDAATKQWASKDGRDKIHAALIKSHKNKSMEKYGNRLVKVTFPDKSTSTIYMYDLYCFCKDHGVYGGNATKVLRGETKQTGKYIFKEIVK